MKINILRCNIAVGIHKILNIQSFYILLITTTTVVITFNAFTLCIWIFVTSTGVTITVTRTGVALTF